MGMASLETRPNRARNSRAGPVWSRIRLTNIRGPREEPSVKNGFRERDQDLVSGGGKIQLLLDEVHLGFVPAVLGGYKEDDEADVSSLPGQHGKQDEADVYDKFVRGEDVSDDEQDEFEPMENTSASCSRASSSSPWDSADEEDSQQETVSLYADLSSAVSVSTSPSHLLAHMTDTSTSPLTRRRFNQMLTGTGAATNSQNGGDDGWMEVRGMVVG
ncbi:hypothetical protein ID866_2173 [Astraeus odoratus]|nr:hypothetical protein ID866_2173 [Astraeus odoratus]